MTWIGTHETLQHAISRQATNSIIIGASTGQDDPGKHSGQKILDLLQGNFEHMVKEKNVISTEK